MAEREARRVMMVTGAGRGIGAAIARLGAARGYDLCLTYRSETARAEATAEACRAAGAVVLLLQADMADESEVARSFGALDARFGRIDALVNNAGTAGTVGTLLDTPLATWEAVMRLNVLGTVACSREAIRRMARSRGGRGGAIVNISSRASTLGGAGEWIHYAASKGATDTLTIGLSKEVAAEGIRVNAVRPGLIETEIHASGGLPNRVRDLQHQVPMKRGGSAEEVAQAIVWLLSPEASYTTMSLVEISGGR
jgi:NAD(P)-dependent dehydrogenase (short-subunit alcohol dehydrogenase family)